MGSRSHSRRRCAARRKYPAEAAAAIEQLRATPHDVMVVAAYGLILPQEVLDIAPHGCINIHASLLPRWRGAAPIHRAIEAGDAETGITLMQMDAGLDTGAMISEIRTPYFRRRHHRHPARPPRAARREADRRGARRTRTQRQAGLNAATRRRRDLRRKDRQARGRARLAPAGRACSRARCARSIRFLGGVATLEDGTAIKIWAGRRRTTAQTTRRPARSPVFRRKAWWSPAAKARCVSRSCKTRRQAPAGARIPRAGFGLAAGQRFHIPGRN